jgi:AraC-like DNA-binding protein
MHHAAVLLQSTDLRLVDIARSVGYRDFAQFSEAFRRYHAVTPGALRRAGRDDAAPMG